MAATTHANVRLAMPIMMGLCFTASPSSAEQVLHCLDTGSTGFQWDKDGSVAPLKIESPVHVIVRVKSETERVIRPVSNLELKTEYKCHSSPTDERVRCEAADGGQSWVFYGRNNYLRSMLVAPLPSDPFMPDLTGVRMAALVAYGTCKEF
jgi:hypothetical protein